MSEGPYRNMSYSDAAIAMRRIYELLYPRKFHSYNPSLNEPFANYVGTREEKAPALSEYTELYGKIGDVINRFEPILGDISYAVDATDSSNPIPDGQTKVILDVHGMAILNSLLEVAELGAKYILMVDTQIRAISDGLNGVTPLAQGNKIANEYVSIINDVTNKFTESHGVETLNRVKNMVTKLSSGTRSGVMAKNVNVVKSISEYQVGQEEVISDAFDKDFIDYFIMYLEAENTFHDNVKSKYDVSMTNLRDDEKELYSQTRGNTTGGFSAGTNVKKKFARYVDISGCRASCVGLCVGSCANTCFGCSDQCAGQCTRTCGDCDNNCMKNCATTCQGSCETECIGCRVGCGGGCISSCTNECGDTCLSGCHENCVGSCYGTALGFADKCGECGSTCKGTCGNSCESETSAITPAPDPTPPYIEEVEPDPEPSVNPDPPVIDPTYNPTRGGSHSGGSFVDPYTGAAISFNPNDAVQAQIAADAYKGRYNSTADIVQAIQNAANRGVGSSGRSSSSSSGGTLWDRGNNADGSPWHGNNR